MAVIQIDPFFLDIPVARGGVARTRDGRWICIAGVAVGARIYVYIRA